MKLKPSVQECADGLGCQEAIGSSCSGEGQVGADPGKLPRGDDAWLMSERMSSTEGQGDKEDRVLQGGGTVCANPARCRRGVPREGAPGA